MNRPPYKNLIYIFSGRTLDYIITFILLALFARLQPQSLGIYYFARSIALLVATFSELGLSRYTIHTLAKDRNSYRILFGSLLFLRILIFGFSFLVVAAIIFYINVDYLTAKAIFAITGAALLFSISDFLLDVLRAMEEMIVPVILTALQRILFVGISIYGLFQLARGLEWIFLIAILTNLFHLSLCAFLLIQRKGLPKFSVRFDLIGLIISEALPFTVTMMIAALWSRGIIALLYYFNDTETIGYYGAAVNIVETLFIIALSVNTVLFPNLVRLYHNTYSSYIDGSAAAFKLLILIILPIAMSIYILADKIVMFIYGSGFIPSIRLLQIAIWSAVAMFINSFSITFLQSIGMQWKAGLSIIPIFFIQLIFGIILIPKFGASGAAISILISEFGLSIVYFVIINRIFNLANLYSGIEKLIFSNFFMIFFLFLLRDYHVLFSIICSGIVYILLIIKFHPFTYKEIQWLRTAVGKQIDRVNIVNKSR